MYRITNEMAIVTCKIGAVPLKKSFPLGIREWLEKPNILYFLGQNIFQIGPILQNTYTIPQLQSILENLVATSHFIRKV